MMWSANILLFLVLPLCWGADDHFRDFSPPVFDDKSGFLAAFADFNSDKAIDVFVLYDSWGSEAPGFRQVDLHLALLSRFKDETFTRKEIYRNETAKITSVVAADLDGDQVQDLLLYSAPHKQITVLWGTGISSNSSTNSNMVDLEKPLFIKDILTEPLLFDHNGNRSVDILTATSSLQARTVITLYKRTVSSENLNSGSVSSLESMVESHSNSFVDLNGDLNPDVLISTKSHFEIWPWLGKPNPWSSVLTRPDPGGKQASEIGQSIFVDFGSTGKLDHIVMDRESVYIYLTESSRWKEIFKLSNKSVFWQPDDLIGKTTGKRMFLKSADLDQDGYPDFMTIIDQRDGRRTVMALMNTACRKASEECVAGRKLIYSTSPGDFSKHPTIVNLGFFDVRENGKMDVIITEGDAAERNWTIKALENIYAKDACFIKVITVSGICGKDKCSARRGAIEYGYNQPGAVAKYSIVDSESKMRSSVAAQLYQTGHGALQLPYVLFGIGLSPNFVESLEVRMPGLNDSHQWTQIIPNSQMLVIPYPILDPTQWQNKLFITPSRKMLVTGITLFGVVLVNIIIIVVLQLMEKKADRIEKQQQAHKFNFDAM